MKKIGIYAIAACTLAAFLLTGCSAEQFAWRAEGENDGAVQTPGTEETQTALSGTAAAIQEYEANYQSGEFQQEDYQALADLYEEAGLIRRQRDLLEQSFRLYGDAQSFEKLQTVAVNLEEESADIQEEARTMLLNLGLEEFFGQSIQLISSEAWFETMMPKMGEGVRNYFLQQKEETVLAIQVGYREGQPFSQVWYNAEGRITELCYAEDTLQVFSADLQGGAYGGDFVLWNIDGKSGDIQKKQGTMKDSVLTGEYREEIHLGNGDGAVYDLWNNREQWEYTAYTGAFDEAGQTTVKQPSAANLSALVKGSDYASCVVYAYDENGENCLFAGVSDPAEAENYTFGAATMEIAAYPEFSVYTVVDEEPETAELGEGAQTAVPEEAPQIRIYDGELQYWVDGSWKTLGTVRQYQKEDPFYGYSEQRRQILEEAEQTPEGEEEGAAPSGIRQGIGSIEPEKPSAPASTPKPSTPSTPKPSTPAAPNPAPPVHAGTQRPCGAAPGR